MTGRGRVRRDTPRFVNAVLRAAGRETIDDERYRGLVAEVRGDRELAAAYDRAVPRLLEINPDKKIGSWEERMARPIMQAAVDVFFVLPRVLRPTVTVETGVASGSMTAFLLAAITRNGDGLMISIDLPPILGRGGMDWTAREGEVGLLVPSAYRGAWELRVGDAAKVLPTIERADLFIHDSDHSFAHQMFEYSCAARMLSRGGVLISDDINESPAFRLFTRGAGWASFVPETNRKIGVAVPTSRVTRDPMFSASQVRLRLGRIKRRLLRRGVSGGPPSTR